MVVVGIVIGIRTPPRAISVPIGVHSPVRPEAKSEIESGEKTGITAVATKEAVAAKTVKPSGTTKATEALVMKATETAGAMEVPAASATMKAPSGVTTKPTTVETATVAAMLGKTGFRRAHERDGHYRHGNSSQ